MTISDRVIINQSICSSFLSIFVFIFKLSWNFCDCVVILYSFIHYWNKSNLQWKTKKFYNIKKKQIARERKKRCLQHGFTQMPISQRPCIVFRNMMQQTTRRPNSITTQAGTSPLETLDGKSSRPGLSFCNLSAEHPYINRKKAVCLSLNLKMKDQQAAPRFNCLTRADLLQRTATVSCWVTLAEPTFNPVSTEYSFATQIT